MGKGQSLKYVWLGQLSIQKNIYEIGLLPYTTRKIQFQVSSMRKAKHERQKIIIKLSEGIIGDYLLEYRKIS